MTKDAKPQPRPYRQTARAEAAAATGGRVVQTFIGFLRERWLDEITLNEVAEAAGVTAQTVIRRFGGKEGLLKAAVEALGAEIDQRRAVPQGGVREIVEALVRDYEAMGDMVIRCLAQEERNPMIKILLDTGRRDHPRWLAECFEPWLAKLDPARRERRMAELLVATDIYTWQLLRRDRGMAVEEFIDTVAGLVAKILGEPAADTPPREERP